MRSCKFANKKRKQRKVNTPRPCRLRGGAGDDGYDFMIERAISNAMIHGINLQAGVRNLADGNCAFETVIDSINTRECFNETLDGDPDEWRLIWMSEVENVDYEK